MRLFCIILVILSSGLSTSQISIDYTRNIDIFTPYTILTQEYLKINDKIFSNTQSLHLRFKAKQNEKISWEIGIVYKRINHVVESKVLSYYNDDNNKVYDELDLISKSNSGGLINQFDFSLTNNQFLNHKIGLSNEFYFIEQFKSYYINEKGENSIDDLYYLNISPLNSNFGIQLFVSSINLSSHYLIEYKPNANFSLATKLSLGTNLYSDWDQFKKYAWLGVGLELGFGNKPLFQKKKSRG